MTFLPVRTGILFFHVHPQIFSGIFVDNLCSKKFGLDVVIYVLLKNIHMHSLNLLNLIYIVACNVETALENTKLMILERLELQIFLVPSQPWLGAVQKDFRTNIFWYFRKSKISMKLVRW